VTRISRDRVKRSMEELKERELIKKEGFLFPRLFVTDMGMEAIGVYRQVYGGDEDISQFDVELREMIECLELGRLFPLFS